MRTVIFILVGLMLSAAVGVASDTWYDTIKLSGDLRYRHEMIDDKPSPARNRHRVRARLGIKATINEYATVGFQFSSGSDDPVSTNQTLGGGMSSKSLVLSQAYFVIKHHRTPGLVLTGGKFKSPFFDPGKSEMIWDSDLGMEGGYLRYKKSNKIAEIELVGAGLWIEERSSESDSYILAGQATVDFQLNENKNSITVAAGFFRYLNSMNHELFFKAEDPMGNSVNFEISGSDVIMLYAYEFELFQASAQLNLHPDNIPLSFYGDFVTNSAADSLNTGYLIGLRVGKLKNSGSVSVNYNYRELERDAVVGAFTNSDFGGGGTNARGHKFAAACQFAKNSSIGLTYFVNETGIDFGSTKDFNRFQADLKFKF